MGRLREKQWFITEDKYGFYLRWVKHDVVCLEAGVFNYITDLFLLLLQWEFSSSENILWAAKLWKSCRKRQL